MRRISLHAIRCYGGDAAYCSGQTKSFYHGLKVTLGYFHRDVTDDVEIVSQTRDRALNGFSRSRQIIQMKH